MKTNSETSPKHDGQIGQNFESLFGSCPNDRPSADVCINGTWYELKTRANIAISPFTLFGLGEKTLQKMSVADFENHVTGKFCNLILAYYDKNNGEVRYTKIIKMSKFNFAKFTELLATGIIFQELHHRQYSFRIRNHNMKHIAQMFDSIENIELSDILPTGREEDKSDQDCPNSDASHPATR